VLLSHKPVPQCTPQKMKAPVHCNTIVVVVVVAVAEAVEEEAEDGGDGNSQQVHQMTPSCESDLDVVALLLQQLHVEQEAEAAAVDSDVEGADGDHEVACMDERELDLDRDVNASKK
jgi:hypothetical protein